MISMLNVTCFWLVLCTKVNKCCYVDVENIFCRIAGVLEA